MAAIRVLVAVVMLAISFSTGATDISKTFTPSSGVRAVVGIKGPRLVWRLSGKSGVKRRMISVDAERISSI